MEKIENVDITKTEPTPKEKNFKKLSFFIQNVIYRSDWNIQLFGNLLRF